MVHLSLVGCSQCPSYLEVALGAFGLRCWCGCMLLTLQCLALLGCMLSWVQVCARGSNKVITCRCCACDGIFLCSNIEILATCLGSISLCQHCRQHKQLPVIVFPVGGALPLQHGKTCRGVSCIGHELLCSKSCRMPNLCSGQLCVVCLLQLLSWEA